MRNYICYAAVGVALMAATSLAQAQTVITREITDQPVGPVIAQQPGAIVVAQEPAVVPAPGMVLRPQAQILPVETVETVRTTRSYHPAHHRIASRPLGRRAGRTVTTTRTIVRERFVPAPAVTAITQPAYGEAVRAPVLSAMTYPAPLYDVVSAPVQAVVAPPAGAPVVAPVPAYRFVYEPNRILVIDANTGIAVQAIPR